MLKWNFCTMKTARLHIGSTEGLTRSLKVLTIIIVLTVAFIAATI